MENERLEALLELRPGQIAAIQMPNGPLYKRKLLGHRYRSWKPYAEPKVRAVLCPRGKLKVVQRSIERMICGLFEPHPIAHAYVKGRSIVTNARQHVGKEWVFRIDLVNFFGSIREEQVVVALRGILLDFSEDEIRAIARLCCHEGVLPQGSPASPILSNLVCFPLDQRLQEFAMALGLTVTRFSDDIFFSSSSSVFPDELGKVRGRGATQIIELGAPLSSLFEPYGFEINLRKLRFQDRTERQQVTGLVVNDSVNVPKEFYRAVRRALRLWEQRGLDVAARDFQSLFSIDKFLNSLRGMIDYIGQVMGRRDDRYQALIGVFKKLRADYLATV